jgi:hypothetical protein
MAAPACRHADGLDGLAKSGQKAFWVGHGQGDKLNCTCRTAAFC